VATYRRQLYLFLLPYLLGMGLLVVAPAVATGIIAFTEYNSLGVPRWVGLGNFQRLFSSPIVQMALHNTLFFILLAVPLRLLGALLLALLLQARGSLFGFARTAVYLPTIIPEVAYALIWLWIFNPLYGPLNLVLGWLGLSGPEWLIHPGSARLAIVIMLAFQLGEGLLILLIGLQNAPRSLFEAAVMDGAGVWSRFWRLTLPLLTPWLLLLTFRDLIMSLQNSFTPSFVLTYGGPYYATTFAPLLIYELAFDYFDFGLAAALLLLIYLLMAGLVFAILHLVDARRKADDL
jgi:multiple sugar transport system permease protein